MNSKDLRALIDGTLLKTGDIAACETLMTSIKMDLDQMVNTRNRQDIVWLMGEVDRKTQDIINMIEASK